MESKRPHGAPETTSTSQNNSPPIVINKSLEMYALLLLRHVSENIPHLATSKTIFDDKIQTKCTELFNSATYKTTASPLAAAMFAALLKEDITEHFKIIENLKPATPKSRPTPEQAVALEDYKLFDEALEILKDRDLIERFLRSPGNRTEKEKTRDIDQMYYKYALPHSSFPLVLILACRLEAFDQQDLAINVYARLRRDRFCDTVQIAHLIRCGTRSSIAQYAVGREILDTKELPQDILAAVPLFVTEAKRQARINEKHLTPLPLVPLLHEVAINCLELAIYAHEKPNPDAVKLLAKIHMDDVPALIRKSTKKACLTLFYGYKNIENKDFRQQIMNPIHNKHYDDNDDIWINLTLGRYYFARSKDQPDLQETDTKITPLDQLLKAFIHYQACHATLTSSINVLCSQDHDFVVKLRSRLYELAEAFTDRMATSSDDIAEKALKLYKQAGSLGYYTAHWKLAKRLETLVDNEKKTVLERQHDLHRIENHYCLALDIALSYYAKAKNDYYKILADYDSFLKSYPAINSTRNVSYHSRDEELTQNLEALECFSKYDPSLRKWIVFSHPNTTAILDKLHKLSDESPMACAILWSIEPKKTAEYEKKMIDVLAKRRKGFKDITNKLFSQTILICLYDYFTLKRMQPAANVFFDCLMKGLSTDDPAQKEIKIMAEFYCSIFEKNKIGTLQSAQNLSPKNCKMIFEFLAERVLLTADEFQSAKAVFEEPVSLIPKPSPVNSFERRDSYDNLVMMRKVAALPIDKQNRIMRYIEEEIHIPHSESAPVGAKGMENARNRHRLLRGSNEDKEQEAEESMTHQNH
ncbi:MAG: hypothetical protein M3R00_00160 [Pseudomonadota bacterium]|nr:hypothetical protein [Pseudomonadota bacterium]